MLPIAQKYWLSKDDGLGHALLLQEYGIFLKRCAKKFAKGAELIDNIKLDEINAIVFEKTVLCNIAKCEWLMRKELRKGFDKGESIGHPTMPPAVLPEPKADADEGGEVRPHSFLYSHIVITLDLAACWQHADHDLCNTPPPPHLMLRNIFTRRISSSTVSASVERNINRNYEKHTIATELTHSHTPWNTIAQFRAWLYLGTML
jgi:hypothetical protein